MNKKKEGEGSLFEGNNVFFGIAMPEDTTANTSEGPNFVSGIARLLVCAGKSANIGSDTVTVTSGGKQGKCKDVSDRWYFGYVSGDYYDASFIVRKQATLKDKKIPTNVEDLWKHLGGDTNNFNAKLLEKLKLATGKGKDFYRNGGRNSEDDGMCKDGWSVDGLNEGDVCFQWVGMDDEGDGRKELGHNCGTRDDFNGCNIGIIDVSRYTREHQSIFLFQNEKNF